MRSIDSLSTRANDFDSWVGKLQTLRAISLARGTSVLDLGCGVGQFTSMLFAHFSRVVGIDASPQNIKLAKETIRDKSHQEYFVGLGESFRLNERFDTILMTMLLEHVDSPRGILKNGKKHLKKNGVIIAQVPNANSLNRRLGKYMGLVEDIHELSRDEIENYGHQRVYDTSLLSADITNVGLRIIAQGGTVFKPFTNDQMQSICNGRTEEWVDKFMNALLLLGDEFPDSCTTIYAVAEKEGGS